MKTTFKPYILKVGCFVFVLCLLRATASAQSNTDSWCNHPLRPGLSKLKEVKTTRPWFKVFDMGHGVYAIDEPYNYEETIAYLILGNKKALLFDTGMGMDSISLVVKQLTHLPIIVLNSHTHFDHIGGNYEFGHLLAMNTAYTRQHAQNGYPHSEIKSEVAPDAFCSERLPLLDTASYHTRPFKVWRYINDGYKIELGGREINVIATPGHAPDAISLWDAKYRYLWTGDTFYEGPIFLFADSTNLKDYSKSITKLAQYAAKAKSIMPAHNLPGVAPSEVMEAAKDFNDIMHGRKTGVLNPGGICEINFERFSFRIDARLLPHQVTE